MKSIEAGLLAILLLVVANICQAQNSMVFRSESSIFSFGQNKLLNTSDGGFLALRGEALFLLPETPALVKYNALSEVEWSKAYLGRGYLRPRHLIQASDGNYIVAAETEYFDSYFDHFRLFKVDTMGVLLWFRDIGSELGPGRTFRVSEILPNAQGGVLLGGYWIGSQKDSPRGTVLMELGAGGNVLWSRMYTVPEVAQENGVMLKAMVVDEAKNIFVAGSTAQYFESPNNLWVAKFDSTGAKLWSSVWRQNERYRIEKLEWLNDSTLILVQNRLSNNDWLAMPKLTILDTAGSQFQDLFQDQLFIRGPGTAYGDCYSLRVDSSKVYLTGRAPVLNNSTASYGAYFIELNHDLDTLLTQVYSGGGALRSTGEDLVLTDNGPVLLVGEQTAQTNFSTLMPLGSDPTTACFAGAGPFILSRQTTEERFWLPIREVGGDSTWTSSLQISNFTFDEVSGCSALDAGSPHLSEFKENVIFPNPGNGEFSIDPPLQKGKIRITSLDGRLVMERMVEPGTQNLNLRELDAGMYLLEFNGRKSYWIQKLWIR